MSIPSLSTGERSSAPARLAILIGLCALLLGCARPVAVADGATIIDGSRHYRLWGIEVPGLHQSCAEEWPAGQIAKQTLEALIGDRRIAKTAASIATAGPWRSVA